ncbi:MAG: AAA family ATPase [Gammaproteobacteria bacterium]|jgi:exodeoxyribonuclease V alpha subunit|nr:AAA family ATPase [Gammaproteobacteria bacterium]MBT4605344.1 AAA family ATPase [Thiotrichales bacterium]MBT3473023.1 AAA family ATPase [Gammaproteobacteria bacterium]MBT3967384.1 AAA family ATPase [Gammaproteobacteria bacterium]MBT4079865.1 AAA family ATPase [Gammaproteobacteria bacterium]
MHVIEEQVAGIVNRVTYHNEESGWSVLRLSPFNSPESQVTVTVHQTKVFAGATMEFSGKWTDHPKFGRQFKADKATEKKPATAAALEKYLGSGLIKGVGPKTAKRIVKHFAADTLAVFEAEIERLVEVPGIATKKLKTIEKAWSEHKAIREVMMFLQGHGISTLFAVRIYKEYGDRAIEQVREDPYRLALDFFGIGFFSADKVALSIGLAKDSPQRIIAAIRHLLAASREQGHCYLTAAQIQQQVDELLEMDLGPLLDHYLQRMEQENHLRLRTLVDPLSAEKTPQLCYYSKSLYYDEETVAHKIGEMSFPVEVDGQRVSRWIESYCQAKSINLSSEQARAVVGVVQQQFSILTGGPGCGKTTTTLVIVRLLEAMKLRVLLAAPTGRAAQRMGEVIGRESKTLHRLLEWKMGQFNKCEEEPLKADFLIIDECSMLDISMSASLLKAVPHDCQLLFIGDPDQLPSVGAGNVLRDIIDASVVPVFRLTEVFRQAQASLIIRSAHQINRGEVPFITSPFKKPESWREEDCLFIDSDEATQDQLRFVSRVKQNLGWQQDQLEALSACSPFTFRVEEPLTPYQAEFEIPKKFQHVNLQEVAAAYGEVDELKSVLKKIHPWSSLHYGLSAVDVVVKLYQQWIPKYQGEGGEIQILSPMTRGTLGTSNLNRVIQQAINPPATGKPQIKVGERIFRVGDRVIHRRNNYELEVFNGDIGNIKQINSENLTMTISFLPDHREVEYLKEDIVELDLAYAITIHKSQGSEFSAVIIPVLTQHFKMLYRNLVYTGLTRARKLAIFVGSRRAMAMAVQQQDTLQRQTALQQLLSESSS